ncbi:Transcription factor TCP8 [Cardamine amara subsp. amara]|uniref:Transcription factor TCP8 n=1 Tax=Cardamine amara subsp. amara TaxID=228776 RepID=A0ABD1ACF3_CARAN
MILLLRFIIYRDEVLVAQTSRSNGGNTFWMLSVPKSAGSQMESSSNNTTAGHRAHLWPFFNLVGAGARAASQFMVGTEFSFPMDQYRGSPLQLCSFLAQPQQPTQNQGLSMLDSNLGMLAALNTYSRGRDSVWVDLTDLPT